MKREMMRNPSFWTDELSFYLDAVSFVHKFNPKSGAASNQSRVWRRREEGLQLTAKGSKELAGGRRLHVIVAIAFGKGVILKVPYEKMTGTFSPTLYGNISTLLLRKLVQKPMASVCSLWTMILRKQAVKLDSPLKISN